MLDVYGDSHADLEHQASRSPNKLGEWLTSSPDAPIANIEVDLDASGMMAISPDPFDRFSSPARFTTITDGPPTATPRRGLSVAGEHQPQPAATKPSAECSPPDKPLPPPAATGDGGQQVADCLCLQPIVFLIEEFNVQQQIAARQGLDSALASLKEALWYCQVLLQCSRCRARPDYVTVLTFLTDKVSSLCENLVAEYSQHVLNGADEMAAGIGSGKKAPFPVVLGRYEIDLASEWNAAVGSLIKVQLQVLYALMGRLAGMSEGMQLELVRGKAQATQQRMLALLQHVAEVGYSPPRDHSRIELEGTARLVG